MDWAAVNYTQLLVNGLAVGGAFLVGYLLAGAVAWWLDKSAAAGKAPRGLHKVAKYLGGLTLAILVALLLFGRGGAGLGGGTGDGFGSGTGAGTNAGTGTSAVSVEKVTPPSTAKVMQTLRVVVLGGADVVAGKFYRVGEEPNAMALADAKAAVLAAKAAAGDKTLGVEIVFPPANALDPSHPAVTAFAAWVRDGAGLTVTFPAAAP